jgi:hypothetical protein
MINENAGIDRDAPVVFQKTPQLRQSQLALSSVA